MVLWILIWGHLRPWKYLAEQNYKAVHLLIEITHLNSLIYEHWLQISFCGVTVLPICSHGTGHSSHAWRLTGPSNVQAIDACTGLRGMCTDAHSHILTHTGTHICTQINTHSHMISCHGVSVFSAWKSFEKLQRLMARHRKTWHKVAGKCSMELFHVHFSRTFHVLTLQPFPSVQTNIVQRSIGKREANRSPQGGSDEFGKEGNVYVGRYGQVTVRNVWPCIRCQIWTHCNNPN